MITTEQLAASTGATLARAAAWLTPLAEAMQLAEITTPARMAAFLPNVGHESGHLVYLREIWGPTPTQVRYEGRRDLGNVYAGDGRKYLGRGLIQITGRSNYIAARDGMRKYLTGVPDFEAAPDQLEVPRWAAHSAGWYWASRPLSSLADAGDFDGVCDVINRGRKTAAIGDSNGYAQRLQLWNAARVAFGAGA
jgi:putative chitinase